jgi:hypothetical protein
MEMDGALARPGGNLRRLLQRGSLDQHALYGLPGFVLGLVPGGWVTGSLGGGVFGGSQDQDIEMSSDQPTLDPYYNPAGPSQWLQAHYIEAVDAGCVADGNSSDDPIGLMKWVLGKMATVVGGAIGL